MPRVTLPDGSQRDFPDGVTPGEIAAAIGRRLAEAAVAARVDGELLDLDRPLHADAAVAIVTNDSPDGRLVLRHSAAHVLAQAVLDLFPGASYAIGPAIEDGFYYDFEVGRPFTPDDLAAIEARMREIVAADQPFVREELDRDAALALFADQKFKQEIIASVDPGEVGEGAVVSVYRNPSDDDGFVDLCRGPHVPSTRRIPAFALTRTSGAYWRGDQTREQLQRVYGTAWESQMALDEHMHRLEEARRRDHRRLGVELDLYSFPDELGAGLAVWHPRGGLVRRLMEDHSRQRHVEGGYDFVVSPHIASAELFWTSRHLDFYAENMFPPIQFEDGREFVLKPMNCPHHILIYKSRNRSYRELPLRFFELGTVYRNEKSGVLHGILRARGFTQDDAHIFCMREQLHEELISLLDFTVELVREFGFDVFEADLSTRNPDKWVGELEMWDTAEKALEGALVEKGLPYEIAPGEGAFYGPKIDVHVRDAIGRRWQLSTLQVDFAQPENFALEFSGADNQRHRPVMIHRALFGSVERFFGLLVEHFAGAFPMWLAPEQVRVLPIADRHVEYAQAIAARLREAGLRVHVDASTETLGAKIRDAESHKIPYSVVVGDRDVEAGTIAVRARGGRDERGRDVEGFLAQVCEQVATRAVAP